jgi:hypothetical protein
MIFLRDDKKDTRTLHLHSFQRPAFFVLIFSPILLNLLAKNLRHSTILSHWWIEIRETLPPLLRLT